MISRLLENKVSSLKKELHVKQARSEVLIKRREDIEEQIKNQDVEKIEKALYVLQKLSETQRSVAKLRLEELGTQALQYSLGQDYRMEIEIHGTRARPQASLYVINEMDDVKTDPLDSNGGGIIDIISIALRMVVLQAQEPFIEGPIILDEPFKMVSKEYIPMLAEFIRKISIDFGRQIIMITHNEYLAESCEDRIIIE